MNKGDFSKYKRSTILLEVQSLNPERFINILWKNGIYAKSIKRTNITTVSMVVYLKDYGKISNIAKKTNSKIRILKRRGIDFILIRKSKVMSILLGCILFLSIMYYLSNFIWKINIVTEKYVSPYEIRSQLKEYGVKAGIKKNYLDVHKLENKILKDNDNVTWVKARIDGVNLNLEISENQAPPKIYKEETLSELAANKDGEIVRVYTISGTPVVKEGDMIKKGDLLVKAEQGKEGGTYPVHAIGDIIAKTFYEEELEVPYKIKNRKRTGKKVKKIYINIRGKQIYLKNNLNKFAKYDKIVDNKKFINVETYYEVEEKYEVKTKDDVTKKAVQDITENIMKKLDKSVKIVDKIVDVKTSNNNYKVRLVIIVEENIAVSRKVTVTETKK
ncbi:sporulation protein YqfD [Haloimpatiens sp. FM7315]|uniref:sporulation protein YqfD n=1 Tax=Haloimpatiens sp. FM7315 TaxID=3298609 RepID=UPI0039776235